MVRDLLGRALGRGDGPRWNWVLRDIDLEVPAGDSVALIGLNDRARARC